MAVSLRIVRILVRFNRWQAVADEGFWQHVMALTAHSLSIAQGDACSNLEIRKSLYFSVA
jgi:hypothetical protein